MENNIEKNTPGPAIGSFIVIAILIAGAIYLVGGQLIELYSKPATENTDDTALEATSTLPEDADLDLIDATTSSPLSDKDLSDI